MLIILVCPIVLTKSWAEDCTKDDLSQTDMNLCTIDYVKKAELELDAVYKKLMKKISPKGQTKLLAAQNAWIAYREKQCEFNTLASLDGSVHPTVVSYCYADLAHQQTKTLQQQLECEEGDLSCGRQ